MFFRLRFLAIINLVSFSSFAQNAYFAVSCSDGSGQSTSKYLIADKANVSVTPEGKITVRGAGIILSKETRKVQGCISGYGYSCHSVGPDPFGYYSETCEYLHDKGWNVLVLKKSGGDLYLSCGAGSSIESFIEKTDWTSKVYNLVFDSSNKLGVAKPQCLIDEVTP